jgi:hypothetical protein
MTTTTATQTACRCGETITNDGTPPHPVHRNQWCWMAAGDKQPGQFWCPDGKLHEPRAPVFPSRARKVAMPTTTPPKVASLCCESQLIPWADVQEGDLVLWDGELCQVDRINPMDFGNPALVLDGDQHNGTIPAGTYAAVKRYQTGEGR